MKKKLHSITSDIIRFLRHLHNMFLHMVTHFSQYYFLESNLTKDTQQILSTRLQVQTIALDILSLSTALINAKNFKQTNKQTNNKHILYYPQTLYSVQGVNTSNKYIEIDDSS